MTPWTPCLAVGLVLLAGCLAADPVTNWVAMRDGVRLATDVYLPEGEGPRPADWTVAGSR